MPSTAERPSVIDSVRRLGRTLAAIVETRLELLATDFQQARSQMLSLLITALVAALCFGVALLLAVLFVVAAFWDSYRLTSIAVLCVLLALAGFVLWRAAVRRAGDAGELFAATRAELARDREQPGSSAG